MEIGLGKWKKNSKQWEQMGDGSMGKKGDNDDDDNVLNFMTWIVIAWMVWSAAKVIDNVLSKGRERERESECGRKNTSVDDWNDSDEWWQIRYGERVCLEFGCHIQNKKENFWLWRASKPARANDDERLKRKRKDKSSINKSKCHISTSFSCHTDWILWMLFYSTQKGIEKDEKKFCVMKDPTEIQRTDHM